PGVVDEQLTCFPERTRFCVQNRALVVWRRWPATAEEGVALPLQPERVLRGHLALAVHDDDDCHELASLGAGHPAARRVVPSCQPKHAKLGLAKLLPKVNSALTGPPPYLGTAVRSGQRGAIISGGAGAAPRSGGRTRGRH